MAHDAFGKIKLHIRGEDKEDPNHECIIPQIYFHICGEDEYTQTSPSHQTGIKFQDTWKMFFRELSSQIAERSNSAYAKKTIGWKPLFSYLKIKLHMRGEDRFKIVFILHV